MRYLITIFLFFSIQFVMGQKRIELTPIQKRNAELTLSKTHLHVTSIKSRIHTYKPYKGIKITFKTTMNPNVMAKIKIAEMLDMIENEDVELGDAIDAELSDLDVSDYMSIMAYDLRIKLYLSRHSTVILRSFVTGIQLDTYNYTLGFSYKF